MVIVSDLLTMEGWQDHQDYQTPHHCGLKSDQIELVIEFVHKKLEHAPQKKETEQSTVYYPRIKRKEWKRAQNTKTGKRLQKKTSEKLFRLELVGVGGACFNCKLSFA